MSDRLFDLLETVFPEIGLRQLAATARDLGAPWEAASVPFLKWENGKAIAHVGVLELPLFVLGQPLTVGGIHAVATHPDFRRQGHYRDCMEAALSYCQPRYETLVLTTGQPELYQPFGFRVVPECVFKVAWEASRQEGKNSPHPLRVLNLQDTPDRTLLHRLLDTRTPVSQVLGVYSEKAVFLVDEASKPLYYAEGLDALLVMEQEGNCLHLFDLVTSHLPPLTEVLECITHPVQEIIFYLNPDRFQVQANAIPHVLEDVYLMVRGSFPAEGQPLMLPRSAQLLARFVMLQVNQIDGDLSTEISLS